jgi:hypothetical protein
MIHLRPSTYQRLIRMSSQLNKETIARNILAQDGVRNDWYAC